MGQLNELRDAGGRFTTPGAHAFFVTQTENNHNGHAQSRILDGVIAGSRSEALRAWLQSINYGRSGRRA